MNIEYIGAPSGTYVEQPYLSPYAILANVLEHIDELIKERTYNGEETLFLNGVYEHGAIIQVTTLHESDTDPNVSATEATVFLTADSATIIISGVDGNIKQNRLVIGNNTHGLAPINTDAVKILESSLGRKADLDTLNNKGLGALIGSKKDKDERSFALLCVEQLKAITNELTKQLKETSTKKL